MNRLHLFPGVNHDINSLMNDRIYNTSNNKVYLKTVAVNVPGVMEIHILCIMCKVLQYFILFNCDLNRSPLDIKTIHSTIENF